jgi:hypothetical protein
MRRNAKRAAISGAVPNRLTPKRLPLSWLGDVIPLVVIT